MGGRRGHKRKRLPGEAQDSDAPSHPTATIIDAADVVDSTELSQTNGLETEHSDPAALRRSPLISGMNNGAGADSATHSTPAMSISGKGRVNNSKSTNQLSAKERDRTSVKRQRREEYRASMQQGGENGMVELPKKRFYRQRAHANPFSDHSLE